MIETEYFLPCVMRVEYITSKGSLEFRISSISQQKERRIVANENVSVG
jgi:hypothetical protein